MQREHVLEPNAMQLEHDLPSRVPTRNEILALRSSSDMQPQSPYGDLASPLSAEQAAAALDNF